MRTFLREETEHKALQIQAIGLSLYEPVEGTALRVTIPFVSMLNAFKGTSAEQIGHEVIRTQWL
jgi:hypothetical protein